MKHTSFFSHYAPLLLSLTLIALPACPGGSGTTSTSTGGGSSSSGGLGTGLSDTPNVSAAPNPPSTSSGTSTSTSSTSSSSTSSTSSSSSGGSSSSSSSTSSSGGNQLSLDVNPGTGGGSSSFDIVTFSSVATNTGQAVAGMSGSNYFILQLSLNLTNTDAFQVVSQTDDASSLFTIELGAPSGETLLNSGDLNDLSPPKTLGIYLDTLVNSLTYPTNEDDPRVQDGTYNHVIGIIGNANEDNISVSGTILAKRDASLSSGDLRANIYLFGSTVQAARTQIEQAVARWDTLYGNRNIDLQPSYFNVSSSNGVVPHPNAGSAVIEAVIGDDPITEGELAVNVFIGEEISQTGDINGATFPTSGSVFRLGVSASAPGPDSRTVKSAVALSLDAHAGADAILSTAEISIMGQTLAHEVGHYLGLFHPVNAQTDGSGNIIIPFAFEPGDQLNDTPTCSNEAQCTSNGLVNNLMFPLAITGATTQDITEDQAEVMNFQPLVD